MWTVSPATYEYEKQRKRFKKKLPRELQAMDLNTAQFLAAPNAGAKPMQIASTNRNQFRTEPQGLFGVTQRREGTERNLRETRLYVWPDQENEVLHLLMIGDKNSQSDDIQFCKKCVEQLKSMEGKNDEQQQQTERPSDEA